MAQSSERPGRLSVPPRVPWSVWALRWPQAHSSRPERWWRRDVPADELRAKIRQVLADPAYRDNARRAGERLRAYGGAAEAAGKIEGLLVD